VGDDLHQTGCDVDKTWQSIVVGGSGERRDTNSAGGGGA
jgi:hypothetical protein